MPASAADTRNPVDRAERARQLALLGFNERTIGKRLGIPRSAVVRTLVEQLGVEWAEQVKAARSRWM